MLRSCLLVALALPALPALAAAPAGAAPEPPTRKERIEEIRIDARGESGLVRTVPLYLDDAPAEYQFGPERCGKGHRLGAPTLSALHAALASGQPVRIDAASPRGEQGWRCITAVAMFAP